MKKLLLLLLCLWIGLSGDYAQSPGNALDFDGSGDYALTALPEIFMNLSANDFTVETWIMPQGNGTERIFYAQYDNSHFASILLNASNVPYVYIYNSSVQGYTLGSALPLMQWSHIALTWNAGSQQILVYVNGLQQTLAGGGSSSTGTNNVMTIGSRTDGQQNLQGALDEFRIWNYARSACEIAAAMNSEFTQPQPGLIAYYKFNEGIPGGNNAGLTNLPDFTGSYNGSLQNFGLSGSASNWVSSGAAITSQNQSGSVNTSITQNGIILTANASGAGYQWLDCNNNYVILPGQTAQTYIAGTDGSYAVEVTQNNCVDTSDCIIINTVGIQGPPNAAVRVYPVPSDGPVMLDLGRTVTGLTARVLDNTGRTVKEIALGTGRHFILDLPDAAGVYFLELHSAAGFLGMMKVVRE